MGLTQVLHILGTSGHFSISLCWVGAGAFANWLVSPGGRKGERWLKRDLKGYKITPKIFMVIPKGKSRYLLFSTHHHYHCPCFICGDIVPFQGALAFSVTRHQFWKEFRLSIWESKGISWCTFSLEFYCLLGSFLIKDKKIDQAYHYWTVGLFGM